MIYMVSIPSFVRNKSYEDRLIIYIGTFVRSLIIISSCIESLGVTVVLPRIPTTNPKFRS